MICAVREWRRFPFLPTATLKSPDERPPRPEDPAFRISVTYSPLNDEERRLTNIIATFVDFTRFSARPGDASRRLFR